MALFGRKKDTSKEDTKAVATDTKPTSQTKSVGAISETAPAEILIRPHITEKAFSLSQRSVYTFLVAPSANAHQISKAISNVYGFTPRRVNIVRKQPRTKRSLLRNQASHQPGYKKAYVYLNKGDTINFM